MAKKVIIGISIVIVLAIAGGVWYYFSRVHPTAIDKILSPQRNTKGRRLPSKEKSQIGQLFLLFSDFLSYETGRGK